MCPGSHFSHYIPWEQGRETVSLLCSHPWPTRPRSASTVALLQPDAYVARLVLDDNIFHCERHKPRSRSAEKRVMHVWHGTKSGGSRGKRCAALRQKAVALLDGFAVPHCIHVPGGPWLEVCMVPVCARCLYFHCPAGCQNLVAVSNLSQSTETLKPQRQCPSPPRRPGNTAFVNFNVDLTGVAPYSLSPIADAIALRTLKDTSQSMDLLRAEVSGIQSAPASCLEECIPNVEMQMKRIRTMAQYWRLWRQDVASAPTGSHKKKPGSPRITAMSTAANMVNVCSLVVLPHGLQ